jgi:hypothetical protein
MKIVSSRGSLFRHGTSKFSYLWNGFKNGYRGRDLRTGWGLKFDFIIIHESGHEWFANNITYKDIADMWIQKFH